MIEKALFGQFEGKDVYRFEICDGDMRVNLIEYGAAIQSLYFNDVDCVAGYDTLEGYINDGSNQGGTVGRYANRIGNARFDLNGVTYEVGANDHGNSLHGGFVGFVNRLYKGEPTSANSVKFTIESEDGDGGYPGNLTMSVTFTLKNNVLSIEYNAVCDKDTIMNFTNHAYFNLGSENNFSTELMIKADSITPVSDKLIPTGEFMDVTGTPFDFRTAKPIGRDIKDSHPQTALADGFDHNFVLGQGRDYKEDCVVAYCPESGITMTTSTDLPGVQLYTSNMLDEKGGKTGDLTKYYAFCLETQFFPDTPNKPQFPSCVVKANEPFYSVTRYKFSK